MDSEIEGIRYRKSGLKKLVEDIDIFEKVVEDVKEEKKISSGLISFICFSTILCLVCSEIWHNFTSPREYEYRFDVDTAVDEFPTLDIDIVVATACNNLAVMSSMDQRAGLYTPIQETIKKDPTRFEFTEEEQMYWTVLRHAHAEMNHDGLRGLEELQYIDSDVEENLKHLADKKQKEEAALINEQRQMRNNNGHGGIVFMVSNGMGMFQLVASSGVDEGTACRVHGTFPVRKGKEEKVMLSIGNSLGLGGMFAHMEGGKQAGNISHRIEKFSFGRRINGLVAPLAGAEQISDSGQDIYRYFIKVVPTRIYHGFFGRFTMAYQYSVTFLKKQLKEGEHSHGGILFEYEFNATVIEIREVVRSMEGTRGANRFSYAPKILNGGFAGVVGVTCVFPIDLVKTRLQNQRIGPNGEAQYKGIVDCAKQTLRSGGISTLSKVRALYSGSAVNIVLITPEKAIKLVANDFFRHKLSKPGEKNLSTFRGMLAGGLAGMFQIIVTTPMELLKIQMQNQGRTNVPGQKPTTALHLAKKLLKENGIAGLYKGLSSTFARDVTFSMIYFPFFAYLDSLGPRKGDGSGDAVFWTSFAAGLLAGASSSFAVTPLDVIKTRMQTIHIGTSEIKYQNVFDAFIKILKMEGPRALFKGAACRMMVMAPLFGIAQTVYYVGVAEKILGIEKGVHI